MLDRNPERRRADRERKARQRAAERAGIKRLKIEANYHRIVEALLRSTRLTEAEALDKKLVEAEVAEVLAEWASAWLK